jgi:hypothetical protein
MAGKTLLQWLYSTTTGWAVMLCLLGLVVGGLLPWGHSWHRPDPFTLGYELLLTPEPLAWTFVVMLFFNACFLVATQPRAPVPLWRSMLLALVGGTIIGLCVYALFELPRLSFIDSPHIGPYFLGAVGAGMVMIATLEIQHFLLARRDAARRRALSRLSQEHVDVDEDLPRSGRGETAITKTPDRDR